MSCYLHLQTKVVLDDKQTSTATKLYLKAKDGSTTTADFEAALRTINSTTHLKRQSEVTRTVTFEVTDAAATNGQSAKTHSATRDVTVKATDDKPVIDMDNPSAKDQPHTGSDSNTIDAVNKTATFDEMQGADTKANAQPFGAVISDLDSDLKSVTVSVNAADVKAGDELLLAGVALDMSKAAGPQTVSVGSSPAKAFQISIAADGNNPAVLTIQSLSGDKLAAKPVGDFNDLLATLSFNNTSDNPVESARVFTLGATDATDATQAKVATFTVDIDATNDIPVVTASADVAKFVEIDGPSATSVADSQGVAIDPGITVTNRDDARR